MTVEEKALARILLSKKILSADGQAFEDLFTDIMGRANPNFVGVKPQGTFGDRKNDGYDRSLGIYYQVYAPENAAHRPQDAVKKLKEDFAGLNEFWKDVTPIKQFHFAFNDKYKGTFPTIEADLADIKRSHELEDCTTFRANHLENELFKLDEDQIIAVVGFIPHTEKLLTIDFSILTEVIGHVMSQPFPKDGTRRLSTPAFDAKLEFNRLGEYTSSLLNAGSYQVGLIVEYFKLNGDFAKQNLRDAINGLYLESIATFPEVEESTQKSDVVFFDVLARIVPVDNQAANNAAIVLMAYYFESCDIFEDPT